MAADTGSWVNHLGPRHLGGAGLPSSTPPWSTEAGILAGMNPHRTSQYSLDCTMWVIFLKTFFISIFSHLSGLFLKFCYQCLPFFLLKTAL